ncbi:MAG TPA: hypothetical protein VEC13_02360 [Candidatus Paceibacterota bacterium]|nr:hypothetical protein [Candidatus Paceibacterota bacterium]
MKTLLLLAALDVWLFSKVFKPPSLLSRAEKTIYFGFEEIASSSDREVIIKNKSGQYFRITDERGALVMKRYMP